MKLAEILEDGQWHPQEEIFKVAGKAIPPGLAVRRNEERRIMGGGPPERVKPLDVARQIEAGRRVILREMILSKTGAQQHRNFLTSKVDGVRMIRMAHLPERVYYQRSRILAESLKPETLTQTLGQVADIPTMLSCLTHDQLLEVAIELAQREKGRLAAQVKVWTAGG